MDQIDSLTQYSLRNMGWYSNTVIDSGLVDCCETASSITESDIQLLLCNSYYFITIWVRNCHIFIPLSVDNSKEMSRVEQCYRVNFRPAVSLPIFEAKQTLDIQFSFMFVLPTPQLAEHF